MNATIATESTPMNPIAAIKEKARAKRRRVVLAEGTEPRVIQAARKIMSEGVLTGPPETPLADAVGQMLRRQYKRFVVVDPQGNPIGLVDRQTALRALL